MKRTLLHLLISCLISSAGVADTVPDQSVVDRNWISVAILTPIHRTRISAEVNAPVKKIYKKFGETFHEGELIMELDGTVLQAQVDAAQAKVEKTVSDLQAKQELYEDSLVPLHELKQAMADAEEAKALLKIDLYKLNATKIRAPYDGKVVSVQVEEHEYAQPPQELIELVDDSKLLIKVLMPSVRLNQLWVGKPIVIQIHEIGKKVRAKITRIGAVIEPASSTIEIEAELDNSNGRLKGGMTGEVLWNENADVKRPVDNKGK